MFWTDERVALLERLWFEGHSRHEIVKKFGKGCTPNMVTGKVKRLNLLRKEEKEAAEGLREKEDKVRAEEEKQMRTKAKEEERKRKERLKLRSKAESWMCKWPIEDEGRFGLCICGRTNQPGKDYCAEHLTEAYHTRSREDA